MDCLSAYVLGGLVGVCIGVVAWGLSELRWKILFDLEDRFDKRYLQLEDQKHDKGWTVSTGWNSFHQFNSARIWNVEQRLAKLEPKKNKK